MKWKLFILCNLFVGVTLACNFLIPTATPTIIPTPRQAVFSSVENEVLARTIAEAEWQTATIGESIQPGGGAETKESARARLDINDGTILRLAPNSIFELKELTPTFTDPRTRLFLEAGKLWAAVTKALGQGAFEIETPVGLSGVHGSLMSAEYTDSGKMITTCLEGACYLADLNGNSVDLKPGEQSEILGVGQSPTQPHTMDKKELDEWTAEFPEADSAVKQITTTIATVGNWKSTTNLGWIILFRVTEQSTIAEFTLQIPASVDHKCGDTEFTFQSAPSLVEIPIVNNQFEVETVIGQFTSPTDISGTFTLDFPEVNCHLEQTWAGSPVGP